MPNNPRARDNLRPFKKNDVRINRKGRPKNFDKLRALAKQIAHEELIAKDGSPSGMSVIEAILRQLAAGDSKSKALFVEIAFGKVPNQVEIKGDMAIRPVIYLPSTEDDDQNSNGNILLDQIVNPDPDSDEE